MKRLALFSFILFSLTASHIVYSQQSDLVFITGGTFTMGSPTNEFERTDIEGPQHQVTVSSFYMEMYQVTQEEYYRVMGVNPSHVIGLNLPVTMVSWYDAVDYCIRRSLEEGLSPAYTRNGNDVVWDRSANGYRLPTEAEWEYACRAGTVTPFSSGTSVDMTGWYSGNSGRQKQPVGLREPNLWGLYDMHGNVFEWCWDLLGDYFHGAIIDPDGPHSGTSRVYRGGCWQSEPSQLRSAFRLGNNPQLRINLVGFRVVRSLE